MFGAEPAIARIAKQLFSARHAQDPQPKEPAHCDECFEGCPKCQPQSSEPRTDAEDPRGRLRTSARICGLPPATFAADMSDIAQAHLVLCRVCGHMRGWHNGDLGAPCVHGDGPERCQCSGYMPPAQKCPRPYHCPTCKSHPQPHKTRILEGGKIQLTGYCGHTWEQDPEERSDG